MRKLSIVLLVALAAPLPLAAAGTPITAHYSGWLFSYLTPGCHTLLDGANMMTTPSWAFEVTAIGCDSLPARVDYCGFASGSVRHGFSSPAPCASGKFLVIGPMADHVGEFPNVYTGGATPGKEARWTYGGLEFAGTVTGLS